MSVDWIDESEIQGMRNIETEQRSPTLHMFCFKKSVISFSFITGAIVDQSKYLIGGSSKAKEDLKREFTDPKTEEVRGNCSFVSTMRDACILTFSPRQKKKLLHPTQRKRNW